MSGRRSRVSTERMRWRGEQTLSERTASLVAAAAALCALATRAKRPDKATTRNDLALLDEAVGDYPSAESGLRRAIEIREKTSGPDHPRTAVAISNLAGLLVTEGDYAGAEPLFQRALK